MGGHVYFIPRGTKACTTLDWQKLATRDLEKAKTYIHDKYMNVMVVGKQDGLWVLDFDDISILNEYESLYGHIDTYRAQSPSGGTHLYFMQTEDSWKMGNLQEETNDREELWSARVNNRYCLAPGSAGYPDNNVTKPLTFYTATDIRPVIAAPPLLLNFLKDRAGKTLKKPPVQSTPGVKVKHGGIHNWLVTQAGKLRAQGLSIELLEAALHQLADEFCEAPINHAQVSQVARSFEKYEPGTPTDLVLSQQPAQPSLPEPEEELEWDDKTWPKFPSYAMKGTSLYENFVKPYCDMNSRVDYFMWLPAQIMLLNYLGPKVKIKGFGGPQPFRGGIYAVVIGQKGKTNKSSSVNDAMAYFNYVGMLSHAGRDTRNAEGRILTWSVGSTEALGIGMQRTNCKNALLVYDELSQLVSKAGIESSSMASNLLTIYEAGKFENEVKSSKESFSHDPDTYCVSLIACTTDIKFTELWSKLAGADTGLDDRFMFILEPETLPEARVFNPINTVLGAAKTKLLVDKAIAKGEYEYEDLNDPRLIELNKMENRYANRAQKWALGLAVDLGLDTIDEECIERAVDIVKYEIAVKNYLHTYEARTREAGVQQQIRRALELAKGFLTKRDLQRKTHYEEEGTSLWNQAYKGLALDGTIREEGDGTKGNPRSVRLLRKRD
jgi:Bifunctional DNA primase/polymerase, N-terminal/Primase C terminal 1 (PriCT-1)